MAGLARPLPCPTGSRTYARPTPRGPRRSELVCSPFSPPYAHTAASFPLLLHAPSSGLGAGSSESVGNVPALPEVHLVGRLALERRVGDDKARRLTLAWMGTVDVTAPTTSAYVNKIEYWMDDDGNRTSVKVTPYGQAQQTTSYTANALNQYTAVGGASPTHDKNGNLTSDGTLDFEFGVGA